MNAPMLILLVVLLAKGAIPNSDQVLRIAARPEI